MRASRQPQRTHTLERAIVDDAYSAADGRGIRFLIDDKIRPDVPCYAAIEYGDDSSVGRKVPFIFLAQGHAGPNRAGVPISGYTTPQQFDSARGTGNYRISKLGRGRRAYTDHVVRGGKHLRTDRIVGPREIDRLAGADPNVRARRITRFSSRCGELVSAPGPAESRSEIGAPGEARLHRACRTRDSRM
jgi:hypothetical protein